MTKQDNNTIRAALLQAGRDEIAFSNGGKDYPTKVEDLPEATLLKIFDYGKRIFNDSVNSAAHQGKDKEAAAKEWLDKAKAGQLGTRAGGSRISPLEKAIRAIVKDYLMAAGWDAKTAAKDVKEPQAAFTEMLGIQISRGKGVPVNQVDAETIEAAFDKNWPKVEEKAAAVVALQADTLDIEI